MWCSYSVKVEYGPATYGDSVADVYDEWYRLPHDLATEAAFLAELAEGGRVLELGVGTGRIAIPLAELGLEVHGIDTSSAMLEQMRAKPGGDKVHGSVGDMADVPVDGEFSLVFVTFNTFFMLTSQEAQVRCFRNVAAHLAAGGRFMIRGFVPDLSRIEAGQNISVREAGFDHVRLDTTVYDTVTQTFDVTQVRLTAQGSRFVHAKMRYAFPPEIDLMAQLAGLQLEARYSDFDKQPFTNESAFHVSVYRA
jgi:SAM-dependent methyltransferase